MTKNKNQIPIVDSFNDENIKVFALGGLGEVGKNMYCIECGKELIIIDSGIMFPDSGFGIDYVIPDYTYLINNQHKIKALFITHGHEDHIGGIPHLLSKVKVPVIYASGLAVELIKNKMSEYVKQDYTLQEYKSDTVITYQHFSVSFFSTNHSIPDSFGIAVKTKLGYILHTGDFKIDFTPLGHYTDFSKITGFAKEGVLCLLADSTNALVNNFSLSEKKIGESIRNIFSNIKGRILISTFASNVYRVQQIIEASIENDRKVIVYGRSMEKIVKVAIKNGYITVKPGTIITNKDLAGVPDDKLTIITTGSQGEPLAALSRISQGIHRQIKIKEGDTIVFSSSAIPGNQYSINQTINRLYRQGANVIVNSPLTDTHTTGHASEMELLMMLSLLKPKYFVAIHGEYSMQSRHIDLAVSTGVLRENCYLLENGDVLTFGENKVFKNCKVQTSNIYIDENYVDIDSSLIKERRILADEGLLSVVFSVDKNYNLLKSNVVTRGFIFMKNSDTLMRSIKQKSEDIYNYYHYNKNRLPQITFSNYLISELSSFVKEKTERKPIIIPIIMPC